MAVHVQNVAATGFVVEARLPIGVRSAGYKPIPERGNGTLGLSGSTGIVDVGNQKPLDTFPELQERIAIPAAHVRQGRRREAIKRKR